MSLPVAVAIEHYQDLLPAVSVEVGGAARTFLFDTGAGISCLTPRVAEELGLAAFGRLAGLRMRGDKIELQQVEAPELRVGGIAVAPPSMGVLDLETMLPAGWPPIDGVLALDAFVAQPLSIDLAGRALVLESAASLVARHAAGTPVPIRVSRPVQGLAREVFVAAELGGRTLWLELDSGNAGPVLLGAHVGQHANDGELTFELGGSPWTTEGRVEPLILDGNLGRTFFDGRTLTLDLAAECMSMA